jgi:hypothetical protein
VILIRLVGLVLVIIRMIWGGILVVGLEVLRGWLGGLMLGCEGLCMVVYD